MQNGQNEDNDNKNNTDNAEDDEREKEKKEMKEKKNIDDNRFIMKALAQFTQLGITMASCVVIGLLIGRFLDWLLGTNPWFMIIFAFVGSGAAIKILYDIGKDWK